MVTLATEANASSEGASSARQEWNAAYYLGLREVVRHGFSGTFEARIQRGLELLAPGEEEHRDALLGSCPLASEHAKACRELNQGSFDAVGRAREALAWIARARPAVDAAWLQGLLQVYEATHPALSDVPTPASSDGPSPGTEPGSPSAPAPRGRSGSGFRRPRRGRLSFPS